MAEARAGGCLAPTSSLLTQLLGMLSGRSRDALGMLSGKGERLLLRRAFVLCLGEDATQDERPIPLPALACDSPERKYRYLNRL